MTYRYARPAAQQALDEIITHLQRHGGACVVYPRLLSAQAFSHSVKWLPRIGHAQVRVELLLLETAMPRARFHAVYFLLADPDEPSSCRFYALELARAMQSRHWVVIQSNKVRFGREPSTDIAFVPNNAYLYCVATATAGVRNGRRWWSEVVS